MCCQSNPPRGKSAPCAVTNRWMKRRWKDMKLLRQFCVLLCNRKEKIMQIRKLYKSNGTFHTKMIWKTKVCFRATSGSSLRQDRGRQEARPGAACAHLRSTAKKNCPDQLLIRRAAGERGKTCCTYLKLFGRSAQPVRTSRGAGASSAVYGSTVLPTHLPAGLPTAGTRRTHEVRPAFCRFCACRAPWMQPRMRRLRQ